MRVERSPTPTEFRRLLGRFASGVTVATAADSAGVPGGMTATAVASVSLEPPLILICVNHADRFCEIIRASPSFAINVLAHDQEHLSRQFAGDWGGRFRNVPYREGPGGIPLLEGVVAHILCERWREVEAGDHAVFFGRVMEGAVFERPPLLHFQGDYASLGGDE